MKQSKGSRQKRQLGAILFADAAGYSRLMSRDEEGTLSAIQNSFAIFHREIGDSTGRILRTAGDGSATREE